MKYAPINVISSYSFLQSGLTFERIFNAIKKNNYEGVGVADNGVLYGLPEFKAFARKSNIQNIFGIRVTLSDSFVVFANNEEGYKNIIEISKLISDEKLSLDLLKKHLKGTTLVLETNYGEFKVTSLENFSNEYSHYLADISSRCDHFYLGLEINNKQEFKKAQEIRKFVEDRPYDLVAFPRIYYSSKEDAIVLKIVNAIKNDEKLAEKELSGEQYFKPVEAYQKLYTSKELEATINIINFSNFDFNQKRGKMLRYPCEDSKKKLKDDVLTSLNEKGLNDESHISRANYEIQVICEMGYEDYFLIVSDYVNYARNHNILVGPGRGSAAGSLVSYLLGITEVDPLLYDLQFERFLNKARKTMPDIDIDFMDIAREDMVQYMRNRYGSDKVANIVAFQTIQAKQALRDIGRIYDIPNHHIDMLSKSITDKMSLREAYKKLETFRKLVDSDKYFLNIVSLASKIEGLPRQAGMHAAGIIINDEPISDVLPVTLDLNGNYISQFEKDYLEDQGFLKMDFLSLRNLTTIDICLKLIKRNKDVDLDFYHIPYEDDKIFEIISSGQTAGVFQLESSGMKGAINILKPKEFNDIVALLSLFRPGPMENIKEYQARKTNKVKVNYVNDALKEILSPTYGIIIYQEQISKIANVMAGFSLEEADLFRRAVSHKEKDVLLSAKNNFISGAKKNGYSEKIATDVFNDILKFANYGFNKSHAVVYAIIACRMAYLKYYYPLEFYTSLFYTSSGANDMKFSEYVSELKRRQIQIFAPDINVSTSSFEINSSGLVFPLSFIKGISILNSNKIVEERMMNGKFKDFYDFVVRTHPIGISESIIIKLIDAGCFDKLYASRETLRQTVKSACQLADLLYTDSGQIIMDVALESNKNYFVTKDDPKINLEKEYEMLGVMISDNPLRYKKDLLASMGAISIEEAKVSWGNVTTAGIISYIKTIKTRKDSSTMAFLKVFDEVGEMEVTIFPRLFADSFEAIRKNNIVILKGRYDHNEEKPTFACDSIVSLEE